MNKLHNAAESGDLERCKKLIKDGINVNAIDKWGNTPLHKASYCGYFEICHLLPFHIATYKRLFEAQMLFPSLC